jgi:competence protein ComEC
MLAAASLMPAAAFVMLVAGCANAAAATGRPPDDYRAHATDTVITVSISEILADPHAAPDSTGEWIELRNHTGSAVNLRSWTIRSANDRPHRVLEDVSMPPHGYVVLGRSADRSLNGGAPVSYAWGSDVALANGSDWLVIAAPDGKRVDSVAWHRPLRGVAMGRLPDAPFLPDADGRAWAAQVLLFGAGDRGTPGAPNVADESAVAYREGALAGTGAARDSARAGSREGPRASPNQGLPVTPVAPGHQAPLVVRVLDVGQGDATLVTDGASIVLVDGGPDASRLGHLLDSLGIRDTTVDLVIATHQHADHYGGLLALFETRRGIRVSRFAENLDVSPNAGLKRLRDSVLARMARDETVLIDTDDPCASGSSVCTFALAGGSRLQLLRPPARVSDPNDRSAIVRLMAPDSAAFSMWLSGDAGHDAIRWMRGSARYDRTPGMRVHVATANHHGSCDGINDELLSLLRPEWMIIQLASRNDYGYVHEQTKSLLRKHHVRWYRTDVNGTVTIVADNDGYTITPSRGGPDESGLSDRHSAQRACRTREEGTGTRD